MWTPKSSDAQVPYRKWYKTMCTVGPLYLRIHSLPQIKNNVFNLWLTESMKEEPGYTGGQLHIY